MSDKMEVLKLLLMFLTVSGYSYVLQPRLTVTQIAALDRDHQSEMRSEPLRNVSLSAEEKEKSVESTERRKTQEEQRSEGLTPETKPEKTRMKEKTEVEMIGFFDSSQEYEEGGEERLIPEMTFSTILGEDTDKVDEVERRVDGPNLKPNEESQTDNSKTRETKKAVHSQNTGVQKKGKDDKIKLRQDKEEEERESKLVAGINHHEDTRGVAHEDIEKMVTVNQGNVEEKRGNEERGKRAEKGQSITNANHNELVEREKENDVVFGNLTPPLSTSSTPLGKDFEIPATLQIITQSPNPTTSPPVQHHNVPPSLLVTPTQVSPVSSLPRPLYAKVSPQFFPPSVTLSNPTTISHISVSTVLPGEVRSVSLLTEVLQSPRRHLKQSELEAKAGPNLEDVMVKNLLFKPARTVIQTTMDINTAVQPQETEFIPEVNAATPKQPNPKPKSNENNPTAQPVEFTHKPNMTQPTGEPKAFKLVENDTKLTVRQNKASLPQPQLAKPSAKPQLTTAKTPSLRPTKINRSSKNKSKEKKRKKDNKTQKPSEKKKEVITPAHFPYFMDNYCPPECACYGRVVQCSDKGVDNVPYGIPYNARYILLMNNHINSIQLDLLNEYVSMEFLVLSNNRLTDGAIEGAFEGVPALKRLYLDKNLLETVPTDLPVSLEELRLDSNRLIVMSEAAWAQCPGLLVLSLSNNTLGNGSESLPNAVFSPLCNLRTLNLDYNQLTLVPLGLPLSIKELYLKGNLIVQFRTGAFNGISDLVVLDMSANRLTNKGLVRESLLNATHLESLNLEGNRLKQVPRHLPRSLKTLNLEGNLISSIKKADLSTLKNLEHLGLARNKIFKVAPGAFRTLPVLHQLDLCHNTLHQVPRQLPQALHSVALTHNKIQSVPRDAFCWGNKSLTLSRLVRVQLEHNLIDMGKLDAQAFRCLRGFQVVHFY